MIFVLRLLRAILWRSVVRVEDLVDARDKEHHDLLNQSQNFETALTEAMQDL